MLRVTFAEIMALCVMEPGLACRSVCRIVACVAQVRVERGRALFFGFGIGPTVECHLL